MLELSQISFSALQGAPTNPPTCLATEPRSGNAGPRRLPHRGACDSPAFVSLPHDPGKQVPAKVLPRPWHEPGRGHSPDKALARPWRNAGRAESRQGLDCPSPGTALALGKGLPAVALPLPRSDPGHANAPPMPCRGPLPAPSPAKALSSVVRRERLRRVLRRTYQPALLAASNNINVADRRNPGIADNWRRRLGAWHASTLR